MGFFGEWFRGWFGNWFSQTSAPSTGGENSAGGVNVPPLFVGEVVARKKAVVEVGGGHAVFRLYAPVVLGIVRERPLQILKSPAIVTPNRLSAVFSGRSALVSGAALVSCGGGCLKVSAHAPEVIANDDEEVLFLMASSYMYDVIDAH